MSDSLELRDHGGCDLILALVQPEIRADQRGHPLAQLRVPTRTRQKYALRVAAPNLAFGGLRVRMNRRRQDEDPPSAQGHNHHAVQDRPVEAIRDETALRIDGASEQHVFARYAAR